MIKNTADLIDDVLKRLNANDISGARSLLESWKGRLISQAADKEPAILILDDDPDILEMLEEYLLALGFKVLRSSSLKAAETQISAQLKQDDTITFAVLDIMLREEHGHDIVPHLLATFPDIKIIFASGHASERTLLSAEIPQVIGRLQKPFSLHALRQLLI